MREDGLILRMSDQRRPDSLDQVKSIIAEGGDELKILIFSQDGCEEVKKVVERVSNALVHLNNSSIEMLIVDCSVIKEAKGEYEIKSIPTVTIVCETREISRVTGLREESLYEIFIQDALQRGCSVLLIDIVDKVAFDGLIARLSNEKKATTTTMMVLDFYADWCLMCRVQRPFLEKLSKKEQFVDKVLFAKVNVDSEVGRYLANEFDISSLPTLCCVSAAKKKEDNFVKVATKIGFKITDDLIEFVKNALDKVQNDDDDS